MQDMASAWVLTTSAAALTAFRFLLTLGFALFVLIGILYGVAQRSMRMVTTTLEGETDRSPSRGPWSTPLRLRDAVRPGFHQRRALKFGAGMSEIVVVSLGLCFGVVFPETFMSTITFGSSIAVWFMKKGVIIHCTV